MHLSDASVYVMRLDQSKKAFFQQINKLSEGDHIHGFSVVLNAVDMKQGGYGYGYYEEDK